MVMAADRDMGEQGITPWRTRADAMKWSVDKIATKTFSVSKNSSANGM
jgi:hypothetical protein